MSINLKKIVSGVLSICFCVLFLFPVLVTASTTSTATSTTIGEIQTLATALNPASSTSPEQLLGKIIKMLLQIVGVATLGLYIYGGSLFMVSGGNSEQQTKGIKILVWTTLGVVVIAGAYMFVNYIFTKIIY